MSPRHVPALLVGTLLSLLLALLVPWPSSGAAAPLVLGAPGAGTWKVFQLWHGPQLGGVVPAGTAIDIAPIDGSPLDVYAVAGGRIVKTCVSSTQSTVFVDTPGTGVIGYVHLATGSILRSGTVATGQRLGSLATVFQRSECATSWTGPHLHLALPSADDAATLAGQRIALHAVLAFGRAPAITRFGAGARGTLQITRDAVRFTVCAAGLAGNPVTAALSRRATRGRPASTRTVTKPARSECVTFADLDGAGRPYAGVPYVARAAVHRRPSLSWPGTGCWQVSAGQGICRRAVSDPGLRDRRP